MFMLVLAAERQRNGDSIRAERRCKRGEKQDRSGRLQRFILFRQQLPQYNNNNMVANALRAIVDATYFFASATPCPSDETRQETWGLGWRQACAALRKTPHLSNVGWRTQKVTSLVLAPS